MHLLTGMILQVISLLGQISIQYGPLKVSYFRQVEVGSHGGEGGMSEFPLPSGDDVRPTSSEHSS